MTPIKVKTALDGQTAIARKVFDFVPIQDAWAANKIVSEMIRCGLPRIDFRTIEGCLHRLKDAGLVKEPERGAFQRVMPRTEAPKVQLQVCSSTGPAPGSPTPATPLIVDAPAILNRRDRARGQAPLTPERYHAALLVQIDAQRARRVQRPQI